MPDIITKPKVISSLFWKLLEQGGIQLIQLVVQIFLARLLEPENFGLIAIVVAFSNIAQVLVQGGLNTALIQKKDADSIDFSSVFYISLFISGVLYVVLFVASPSIANYYQNPELSIMLRVIALTLFPGALNSVQYAFISKNLLYRKLFYNSLSSTLLSGVAGVWAALSGFGAWALVIQRLVNQISISLIMWFTVKWRPTLQFSFTRVKSLFYFGGRLMISNLLDTFYMDLRTLVIGRKYSAKTLAHFNRGQSMPNLLSKILDGSIQSVMLPTMSSMQDQTESIKRTIRRSIKTSSFLVFPLMAGFAATAEAATTIVLGQKWLPAVPFLQIFCLAAALRPVHSANLQAINAVGRSDIYLKLSIIKNLVGILLLIISVPLGIYFVAFGQIVFGIISALINAWPNKTLFNYSAQEQLTDVLPSLILSGVMGIIVYPIKYLFASAWLTLIIQVLVGVILYIGFAIIFKMESFVYIKNSIHEIFLNRTVK